MRAVIQRVSEASIAVEGRVCAAIDKGLLVYLGVGTDDTDADVAYLADKVCHLRIFPGAEGHMNLDLSQVKGGVLVVSAFTVQADARRGRRPTFDAAARADSAEALYEKLCATLAGLGVAVERGSFGDHMDVRSINDGPVCILLDSKRTF